MLGRIESPLGPSTGTARSAPSGPDPSRERVRAGNGPWRRTHAGKDASSFQSFPFSDCLFTVQSFFLSFFFLFFFFFFFSCVVRDTDVGFSILDSKPEDTPHMESDEAFLKSFSPETKKHTSQSAFWAPRESKLNLGHQRKLRSQSNMWGSEHEG